MRLLHSAAATSVQFDESNLVSCAGLVPVMRLAQDCGLSELVAEQVSVAGPQGANTPHKIGCVVAGMIAGADSIDDLDVLRHGGMGELFDGVRAPSTLGSFLRAFSWGTVSQLEAVSVRLLAELATRAPVLPQADQLCWLDVDSCQRRVYGHGQAGRRVRPRQGRWLLGAATRAAPADRGHLRTGWGTAGQRDPAARGDGRVGARGGVVREGRAAAVPWRDRKP